MKRITLITPSLGSGGAERVMAELSAYFAETLGCSVTIIILTKQEAFYAIPPSVKIIEPDFDYKQYSRPVFTAKILGYLRRHLKSLKPDAVLSFGGRYNSFVLLSAIGLGLRVFISDRDRPGFRFGALQDRLNPIAYKWAEGIIAQTTAAKEFAAKQTGHKNIAVIPNPIRITPESSAPRENIVLSVGRFITSKHQDLMLEYFSKVPNAGWKLVFLGNGPNLEACKQKATAMGLNDKVVFEGAVKNVSDYYSRASVFAFTSTSEGFPNALGEAMAAGLPCISFDCLAGPADMIDHTVNGFLTKEKDEAAFTEGLKALMQDETLRQNFGSAARKKLATYSSPLIAQRYFDFMFPQENKSA